MQVGKLRVSVAELGVDLLTIAGHKFYAPKGVGLLYVRRGTSLVHQVSGGGQERGIRAGTENVAYIAGMATALELAYASLESRVALLQAVINSASEILDFGEWTSSAVRLTFCSISPAGQPWSTRTSNSAGSLVDS